MEIYGITRFNDITVHVISSNNHRTYILWYGQNYDLPTCTIFVDLDGLQSKLKLQTNANEWYYYLM